MDLLKEGNWQYANTAHRPRWQSLIAEMYTYIHMYEKSNLVLVFLLNYKTKSLRQPPAKEHFVLNIVKMYVHTAKHDCGYRYV
jgi:hypothetical protein